MPAFWLDLFSHETWREFMEAGSNVSGFSARRRATVAQIEKGDFLLCYMTGISRWIGILEVTRPLFEDTKPIWKGADFPCRVGVKVVVALTPETAIPIFRLRDELSFLKGSGKSQAWTAFFRGSPRKMKPTDAQAVVSALHEAQRNPVATPVDPVKLNRRPRILKAKIGPVTIPETEQDVPPVEVAPKDVSAHSEIQWLLLKLGSDMGLDVWVARNDKGREVKGKPLSALPRIRSDLPLTFDEATNKTIELIDVLWLDGNKIIAAFEIESTTSIYSGLLRMSDLVAMQPNINIPLYLVAPDERREKVVTEVNRPTFSRLMPKLKDICRYIPFSTLKEKLEQTSAFVRYLKPDFLADLSESCEIEDGQIL